jgi:hypothetical protein
VAFLALGLESEDALVSTALGLKKKRERNNINIMSADWK